MTKMCWQGVEKSRATFPQVCWQHDGKAVNQRPSERQLPSFIVRREADVHRYWATSSSVKAESWKQPKYTKTDNSYGAFA